MGFAFSDGEDGHEYCYATTWQAFIGTAFHLIQQTGGTLTLNGQHINAAAFADTKGSPATTDTVVVLESGETVELMQLFK